MLISDLHKIAAHLGACTTWLLEHSPIARDYQPSLNDLDWLEWRDPQLARQLARELTTALSAGLLQLGDAPELGLFQGKGSSFSEGYGYTLLRGAGCSHRHSGYLYDFLNSPYDWKPSTSFP